MERRLPLAIAIGKVRTTHGLLSTGGHTAMLDEWHKIADESS